MHYFFSIPDIRQVFNFYINISNPDVAGIIKTETGNTKGYKTKKDGQIENRIIRKKTEGYL
ncbi:MAG: hypothetical protein GY730_05970 [bacterium]|nr:hypothetical protein [bacterium]